MGKKERREFHNKNQPSESGLSCHWCIIASALFRESQFVETLVYKFYQDENEWHLFAVTLIIIPGPLWGHDPWHPKVKADLSLRDRFPRHYFLPQIIGKIQI